MTLKEEFWKNQVQGENRFAEWWQNLGDPTVCSPEGMALLAWDAGWFAALWECIMRSNEPIYQMGYKAGSLFALKECLHFITTKGLLEGLPAVEDEVRNMIINLEKQP